MESAKTNSTFKKFGFWRLLLSLSPMLIIIIGVIFAVAIVALLIFTPFLIMSNQDQLSHKYNASENFDWDTPSQLDSDGQAYMWPVPTIARMTSEYGTRIHPVTGVRGKMHHGIDIAAGPGKTGGQPIYAMAGGTVTVAGPVGGYGQAIYIDHGNGLVSKYGHLEAAMDVDPGSVVTKGQRIGRIGYGQVGTSTGEHLHFQIEKNGSSVNPLNYVQPPGSSGPSKVNNLDIFVYKPLNIEATMKYLQKKNSSFADRSILEMLNRVGKEKNVDPHLLLAIPGQEQSFVPRSNNQAELIMRNPWNVFGCWCSGRGSKLNTEEAAKIAANTIIKLSKNRPEGRDPIEWLSAKDNPSGAYAGHGDWWRGVSTFYKIISALDGG
ncbi:M23 family metallopeptidase [Paenibacillus amylolyticus]|uniref:M23 family metallopeptidase n=1 Tax=Paenibacillus amylolyticus TaxID=1451 RepID=A0ABD8B2Y1_PAEAM